VERALGRWEHGKPSEAGEFSRGSWGPSTEEYIHGLKKISGTRWENILSGTQRFTPYKPHETTPERDENYRTKAPESGKATVQIFNSARAV
jgi:hypothetical protein